MASRSARATGEIPSRLPRLPAERPVRRRAAPRRVAAALLALAAGLLAGCLDRTADAPGEGDPVQGGTLVIAGPNDLDFANSLVSAERYSQEFDRYVLFLPLIRYGEDLDFEPALARSWELLGDSAVIFRLRQDVRWHDGPPTTAYDVAFSFERAKDPATAFPNADYFRHWTGVEVQDSFTVRFAIEPHADPLASWPFFAIMPRHHLEAVPPERMRQAEFNKNPVGNGPFRFVSYRANDRWVFEANPDFPAELGGRPYLDRVIWRVVPENAAQITEIQAGNVDLILAPRAEQFERLREAPGLRGIVRPGRQFAFLGWNGRRPPLDDPRVRRALVMGLDRRRVLDGLRAGLGELGVGPVAPYHWAFDRSLEPIPHDPEGARRLLAEAGFMDRNGDGYLQDAAGRPLSIEIKIPAANDFNRDMAELFRADLDQLGVRVATRATEFGTLVGDISSRERRFDAVILAWESDFRINVRDLFHSGAMDGPFQMASYSNPEVDQLIDRTARSPDRATALPLYHRLQQVLLEEQPWSVLYYFPDLAVVRERVKGTEMDIRGAFVNLHRWWIQPPASTTGS
jgi:peptide/nickel transport system substrate-binding protein